MICSAVHGWLPAAGVDEKSFVDTILTLLRDGGYLFFASHEVEDDIDRYRRLCGMFESEGMVGCLHTVYLSGGTREITVYQKQ